MLETVAAVVLAGSIVRNVPKAPPYERRGEDIVLLDSTGGDVYSFAYVFAGWKRLGRFG